MGMTEVEKRAMKGSGGGTVDPILVSIPDAARILGVGRSTVYELMARGDLDAVKLGARTLIVVTSIYNKAAALPRAAISPTLGRRDAQEVGRRAA